VAGVANLATRHKRPEADLRDHRRECRLRAKSTFFLQCSKCLLQSNGSRFVSLNSEIRMRVGFWIWHRMEWTQRYDIDPRSAKVALAVTCAPKTPPNFCKSPLPSLLDGMAKYI
jgi:hypothetical protein